MSQMVRFSAMSQMVEMSQMVQIYQKGQMVQWVRCELEKPEKPEDLGCSMNFKIFWGITWKLR